MVSRVARVVSRRSVDRARLDQLLQPRTHPFVETPVGDGTFTIDDGPVRDFRRSVSVEPQTDGTWLATEIITFKLAIPYFWWFFGIPIRFAFHRPPWKGPAWWMPNDRFDRRATTVLATLSAVAVLSGYLNTLFSQTATFAADEFHATNTAQGVTGGIVRVGGLLALVIAASADRRGRRKVLLWATGAGCALAATGALAPSLAWLGASQALARAFATAMLVVITVVAAEEMPAGSRAYALSLLAMADGLGAGFCVMALRLADIGERGWRLIYVLPLLGLLLVPGVARRLPETRRFVATHVDAPLRGHGRRLLLLAVSLLLVNLYAGPSSQFFNRFLKHERHYTGGGIALITILTSTPGAIGLIVGGVLADRRGRRAIAAVSLVAGTALSVGIFYTYHWEMWLVSTTGTVVFAASVAPLAVYGPELFPTSLRGRVNGIIGVAGLAGSAIGLVLAGVLTDHFHRVGPAMALLAVGPILLAILIIVFYPETAGEELETLNPEDAPTTIHLGGDWPPQAR
jgi:MFS family permease